MHSAALLRKGFEFTDYTVKEKKQYEYRVLAENEGGVSVPSSESATVKAKPFKGPQVSYCYFAKNSLTANGVYCISVNNSQQT